MKRWLAVGWAVVATGCGVAVGLAGCSSDDEQDGGSSAGTGGTGGSTGGTGGSTGGTGGSTGGTGGSTGGTGGSTGGTGGSTGGTGGSTGGTGGGTGGTATGGTSGTGGSVCGNPTGGPAMVQVSGGYCIDATEVTRDQYATWLSTSPSTSGQPSYCSWNDSYTPTCEWPAGTKGNHPVVCVDWCDAYAYCKGVGKRLCGKIGGGANEYGDYGKASASQWYNVCTSNGQNDYPYGDTYAGSTCNGEDAGNAGTVPVASMSGCQSTSSGYTGVYDLSGNVWEWEDSCNGSSGISDNCRVRGGGFDYLGADYFRCSVGGGNGRGNHQYSFGFRCCSAP